MAFSALAADVSLSCEQTTVIKMKANKDGGPEVEIVKKNVVAKNMGKKTPAARVFRSPAIDFQVLPPFGDK